MTEDMIERKVEQMVNHLDARLMSGELTQKNYNAAMRELNQWAKNKYAQAKRREA